jgi:hypothetical protein
MQILRGRTKVILVGPFRGEPLLSIENGYTSYKLFALYAGN